MKSFLPWFQFPSFDFELYRRSLVGQALLDSLAEIDDFISEEQAYDIVGQFVRKEERRIPGESSE